MIKLFGPSEYGKLHKQIKSNISQSSIQAFCLEKDSYKLVNCENLYVNTSDLSCNYCAISMNWAKSWTSLQYAHTLFNCIPCQ